MKYTMYYILGAVAIVYLLISRINRRKSKDRKSRKFMGDYSRDKKKDER
ncbi:MAG: hypothetical protein WBM83_06540 [Flavobacteriaceae bacterium]